MMHNVNSISNPAAFGQQSAAEQSTSTKPVIDFTRSGWRKLQNINSQLGSMFIRPFVMKDELADYIAAHEARGIRFDSEGEDIRYDGGVHVVIRKLQGVWQVVDVYMTEEPVAFKPIFFWNRVKQGVNYLLVKFVIGWRNIMAEKKGVAASGAVV